MFNMFMLIENIWEQKRRQGTKTRGIVRVRGFALPRCRCAG